MKLFVRLTPSLFGHKNLTTLYHEFTHLALSHKLIYPRNKQPSKQFPFWFAEGIATYAEAVSFVNGRAVFSGKNNRRFKLFQSNINRGDSLVAPLIKRDYTRGFSLNHYAVSWGLVSYILNSPELRPLAALFVKEFPEAERDKPFVSFKNYFLRENETYSQWEERFVARLKVLRTGWNDVAHE